MSKELINIIQTYGLRPQKRLVTLEELARYTAADVDTYFNSISKDQAEFERIAISMYRGIAGARGKVTDEKHLRVIGLIEADLNRIRSLVWSGASPHLVALEAGNFFSSMYRITVENSQDIGSEATKIVQGTADRWDPMRIEIEDILDQFAKEKVRATPTRVMQKLVERCGKEGGCCAAWRHQEGSDGKPVILWIDFKGEQQELSMKALESRLSRLKRKAPR